MSPDSLVELNRLVLWMAFVLSFGFGVIAHRTHFCTMGAISDVVNMGDWTRMRQWGAAAGVVMIAFALFAYAGLIEPTKTLYSSPRFLWLSAIVGGLLFGFGMVLASGCGSKSLVRAGGGSLKSVVVLVVMGLSGFATLKGVTAVLRVETVDRVTLDIPEGASLPGLLHVWAGTSPTVGLLILGIIIGSTLLVWGLRGPDARTPGNLLAGLGIGAVVAGMWWTSGHLGFVAEHPQTLEATYLGTSSGRAEAMSFVAPVSYALDWLMFFSDKSKVLTVGIASVVGVIFGAAVNAVVSGTFRWEGFAGTEDLGNHLVGAVLMGVGGVTGMGCSIGQGLSGVSTLSLTSLVAVASIMAGARLALRYQTWRLDRLS